MEKDFELGDRVKVLSNKCGGVLPINCIGIIDTISLQGSRTFRVTFEGVKSWYSGEGDLQLLEDNKEIYFHIFN